ncbi:MAG: pyridoxine 5'-phosphate synthase [Chitinophagales bacterium]|nr:pyridoxine 5'-phosphate synthase [Chitinophagales bacterium]
MTKLSVNINKVALIRNSRGGNYPDLLKVAADCERFGADGITIHPRPDERHARYQDAYDLKAIVATELNIEGKPNPRFMQMVKEVRPHQCTLVPDADNAITSDAGWDTIKHEQYLKDIITELKSYGIRVSIFIDPIEQLVEGAAKTGTDRIEFYTGPYAHNYGLSPQKAIEKYIDNAIFAHSLGLGINAGHDLNLDNLPYFKQHIPHLAEVSIGHALISDALYYGLENTIRMYQRCLA